MLATFFGVLTAAILIILTVLFSKHFPAKLFAATNLCSIAFIYVGFALQGNAVDKIIMEVGAAIVFYFITLIGLTKNNYLLGYGIILHGVWDIFHHDALIITTSVPFYWPSFCFVVDIILGLYFVWYFKKQNRKLVNIAPAA